MASPLIMGPQQMPLSQWDDVGDALRDFYLRSHRMLDQAMSAQGASYARAKMLQFVKSEQPVRSIDIASWFGFAPRTVTEAIDALEREGLLLRAGDPHDRRAKRISLTPAGEHAVAAAETARRHYVERVFSALDAAECDEIIRLIGKLNQRLSQFSD